MTFGSLFAGIGGMDLGLERAGHRCLWQVEIDDYCRRVLARHWPSVMRYADIKEVDWDGVEHPEIICGGFPCQPVSVAGKRLAQFDDRWLWPEFARCVRDLRPRYVVVENVAGLLIRGLDDVLGDLAALGYDAEWDCFPASDFGAPHQRQRIWIVANADGERGTGLVAGGNTRSNGQRWTFGAADLQCIADHPFEPGDRWPKPLLRRGMDGIPGRVDRVRALGNAVVPHVAEWIGGLLK